MFLVVQVSGDKISMSQGYTILVLKPSSSHTCLPSGPHIFFVVVIRVKYIEEN